VELRSWKGLLSGRAGTLPAGTAAGTCCCCCCCWGRVRLRLGRREPALQQVHPPLSHQMLLLLLPLPLLVMMMVTRTHPPQNPTASSQGLVVLRSLLALLVLPCCGSVCLWASGKL
jgi:hypothetical protein